jgi:hypothetical protein
MSRYGVSYTLSRLSLGCSFSLINRRCYHRQVKTFANIKANEIDYYFKRFQYLKGESTVGIHNISGNDRAYYITYIVNDRQLTVCWAGEDETVGIISAVSAPCYFSEEIVCGFCWERGNYIDLDYDDTTIWSDKLNIRTNTNSTWELFKTVLKKIQRR